MKNYKIDEIFDKKLYFILPFYMFNEEQKLRGMEKNDYSSEICDCCYKIKEKLDNDNSLSLFEKKSITTMFMQVMNALSNNNKAKALCGEVEKNHGG